MQPAAMGPTLPSYPSPPPAPPAPLQTISHQAAGVDLGCASCGQSSLGDIKAWPTWAKVLAGAGGLTVIIAITAAIARRR